MNKLLTNILGNIGLLGNKLTAQQLGDARPTAVMQAHISCWAVDKATSSEDIIYIFQRLLLYVEKTY